MSNRRTFLKFAACGAIAGGLLNSRSAFAAAVADDAKLRRRRVIEMLADHKETIDAVDLYGIQVDAERRFSWGVVPYRRHVFVAFRLGNHTGWSEVNVVPRKDYPDPKLQIRRERYSWYRSLVGKTVGEALAMVEANRPKKYAYLLENAEICLIDLAGRLLGKPANELLGLTSNVPTPGVYCILTDDPAQVKIEAQRSLEQNLRTHLKVKLYGSLDVDLAVIRAAREVMGDSTYIIGDVNHGYRRKLSDQSVEPLVKVMHKFQGAGLSACEDPAKMSTEQWVQLQSEVGKFDLVPDAPVRHAWRDFDRLEPGMGQVFNLHPSGVGGIFETVALGAVIRSWGKRLMVGDASLVGPACAAWTQLACGMQADWVEAIEKPQESQVFAECLLQNPIERTDDHRFAVAKPLPGFGVKLDEQRLQSKAFDTLTLN